MNRTILPHHVPFLHIDVRELRIRHSHSPVVAFSRYPNYRYFLLISSPYVIRKRLHVAERPLFRVLHAWRHLQAINKTQWKNKTVCTPESVKQSTLGINMAAAWRLEGSVSRGWNQSTERNIWNQIKLYSSIILSTNIISSSPNLHNKNILWPTANDPSAMSTAGSVVC